MSDDTLANPPHERTPIPPCPACGSAPAATDIDDICPKCGAYAFLCGIATHVPLGDSPLIHQQIHKPRWKRIPPSQVNRPQPSPPIIPLERGDPSRCPGCKAEVPGEYATLPKLICSTCGHWELQTGLCVVPAAGPIGTPPSVVRLHAPLWQPLPPVYSAPVLPKTSGKGDGTTDKEPSPNSSAKRIAKKTRGGPKRNRIPRTVTLLLAILQQDRKYLHLNYSELAGVLGVAVSSVSRAFHHKTYGPQLLRLYADYHVPPPNIRQI